MATLPAILLSVLLIVHLTSVLAGWLPRDESRNLTEAFNGTPMSFSIEENWRICHTHVIFMTCIVGLVDYAPIMKKAFKSLQRFGGGSIRLKPGTYTLSSSVKIPSSMCIIGAGMDTTIIKYVYKGGVSPSEGLLVSSRAERVSVIGLTIDGGVNAGNDTRAGFSGVHYNLVNFAWFRNVRVRGFGRYGCTYSILSDSCQASVRIFLTILIQ